MTDHLTTLPREIIVFEIVKPNLIHNLPGKTKIDPLSTRHNDLIALSMTNTTMFNLFIGKVVDIMFDKAISWELTFIRHGPGFKQRVNDQFVIDAKKALATNSMHKVSDMFSLYRKTHNSIIKDIFLKNYKRSCVFWHGFTNVKCEDLFAFSISTQLMVDKTRDFIKDKDANYDAILTLDEIDAWFVADHQHQQSMRRKIIMEST
jgi:hypothetical protein